MGLMADFVLCYTMFIINEQEKMVNGCGCMPLFYWLRGEIFVRDFCGSESCTVMHNTTKSRNGRSSINNKNIQLLINGCTHNAEVGSSSLPMATI